MDAYPVTNEFDWPSALVFFLLCCATMAFLVNAWRETSKIAKQLPDQPEVRKKTLKNQLHVNDQDIQELEDQLKELYAARAAYLVELHNLNISHGSDLPYDAEVDFQITQPMSYHHDHS